MPSETAAVRSWARFNLSALKAVICFSCLVFLGSSCAKKTEEAILGGWAYPPRQIADAGGTLFEYMTFSKDGQVRHYALAEYKNGRCVSDYDLRRRYSFDANGNLLVEMADGRTHRYKVLVHFTGRKLTLTEIPGGTSYTLEKDIQVYSCG
jgi:hypothetical protein